MCGGNESGQLLKLYAGRQTAADDQQRTRLNFQHLILKLVELVIGQRSAWHDKTILFTAGLHVDMKILSGPIFGFDGGYGNIFVGEQCNKMLSGCSPRGENRRCGSAKMGNCASDVDTAAAGFKNRRGTTKLTFRVNLRGDCCAIERGRKCQRIDTYHLYLLLG